LVFILLPHTRDVKYFQLEAAKRTMRERVAFFVWPNFTTDCFHHGILVLGVNTFLIKAKCEAALLSILLVVANKHATNGGKNFPSWARGFRSLTAQ